ncbi:MAG: FHA domain-containing protein [Deltaproteobacteria bacterium]|nr:FHA domain-containing protein [Deltaproteobacteria bacterium]
MLAEKQQAQSNTVEFPLNQRLLEDSLKLKEERRILKERLQKIEANRSEVSATVFEKVHGDYLTRLQNVTDQLLAKKQDIDRELGTLYDTRDKIEGNLKNHKHTLEELQFRHKLGEFTKEEFHSKAKIEEDKIARFEQVLAGVQSNIKRYEGLFEGDEDLFGEKSKETGPLSVAEEIDEWEQEEKDFQEPTPIHPEKSSESIGTPQDASWLEATKPNLETHPTLTIIAGHENVGKSFQIQGTLTIGRSHTNQVILKDAKASRQHAEIRLQGNEYVLIDLNSSNGSMVNGHKVTEQILAPDDEIQIGDFVMQFQM